MRSFNAAVGALTIFACNAVAAPKVGEEFQLKVGERTSVEGVAMSVTFRSVIDDSRCPRLAECAWAGNGSVVVETALNSTVRTDTLNTLIEPRVVHLGSVQLQLVELAPYPDTPGSIEPENYAVTLTTRAVRRER